jgi:crotonobetainyl-CoA:carnitine CoA-transferase CaiB-like acyl-CoA transferase
VLEDTGAPQGALAGVRVLDMTSIGMGPYATQMLGDLGADVIKVEPAAGDVFRHVTPQRHAAMSHAFMNFNRNKRSVVLDAKSELGREAMRRLVARSDVFVSNVRPRALRRLGLDHASMRAANPRIVHCVCYGYGEAGPYAGRAGIDDTIQAATGLAWLQGFGQDAPRYVNTVIADKVVGLQVAQSIVTALYARERTGRGQAIEVPMFETMVAFLAAEHLGGRTFVPPEGEAGYARMLTPHRRPFRTRDGWMAVVPYTDGQWRRFFELAGEPAMAEDPKYATAVARSRVFGELYAFVERVLAARTTAEWTAMLAEADVPFAPVNDLDGLLQDPHLDAIGFWRTVDHPSEGTVRVPGFPVSYSDTPASLRRLAPRLGEHTDEVLREIGLAPDAGA